MKELFLFIVVGCLIIINCSYTQTIHTTPHDYDYGFIFYPNPNLKLLDLGWVWCIDIFSFYRNVLYYFIKEGRREKK